MHANLKTKQNATKDIDACGRLFQVTPGYLNCVSSLDIILSGERKENSISL